MVLTQVVHLSTFDVDNSCGEQRKFMTEKSRDMWQRLHNKKCECCRKWCEENRISETHIYRRLIKKKNGGK